MKLINTFSIEKVLFVANFRLESLAPTEKVYVAKLQLLLLAVLRQWFLYLSPFVQLCAPSCMLSPVCVLVSLSLNIWLQVFCFLFLFCFCASCCLVLMLALRWLISLKLTLFSIEIILLGRSWLLCFPLICGLFIVCRASSWCHWFLNVFYTIFKRVAWEQSKIHPLADRLVWPGQCHSIIYLLSWARFWWGL